MAIPTRPHSGRRCIYSSFQGSSIKGHIYIPLVFKRLWSLLQTGRLKAQLKPLLSQLNASTPRYTQSKHIHTHTDKKENAR